MSKTNDQGRPSAGAGAAEHHEDEEVPCGLSRKRTVRTQEPLRVGLEDLRNVDKRGKWWLEQGQTAWAREAKQEKLLEIARQHGMNTAVRQSIFVILISSHDYLDCVERLQSLKFSKDSQRREVVRVLLSCIGSERTFNPYYAVLANRFGGRRHWHSLHTPVLPLGLSS
ncbi:hypothetical protein L7F22_050934 [Adiantum nelumboides]|nr:hypothetical protein [Adiantum nelumboides]